jgi:hypothetical protein
MSTEDKNLLDMAVADLKWFPTRDILVKPLADEYVEKEITQQVSTGEKDSDGYEITDATTTVEKVKTTFKRGIVLRIPSGYEWQDKDHHPEVGDIIAYPRKSAIDFDLHKDCQAVNPYNVIAFIRQ